MSAPAVDVAIPVYERATYVAEAISSVLAQSVGDWRLTVSEDGPGNAAVKEAVAPFLDDPRIEHVTTGTRLGLPRHKSRLIQIGTARHVAILDDDDLWGPDYLARRVDFLDAHPECGFVFSGHEEIDGQGTVLGESDFIFEEGVVTRERYVAAAMVRNVVGTPTMVVRRSAYEACGPEFDVRFARICDYEMSLRLGIRFPVGYLRVRDARYRLHGERMSLVHDGGIDFHTLVDHVDEMLAADLPSLRRPERDRRRQRADHLVSAGLDAIEAGERRQAAGLLRRAAREDVGALLSSRGAGAAFVLVPGRRGGRWLGRARDRAQARHAPSGS